MVRAKKSLGQHFLNAPFVVDAMIDATPVSQGEVVIEIGPGKGVLTKSLLEHGYTVHAYELDTDMVNILKERFEDEIRSQQLVIFSQDIMDLDIASVYRDIPFHVIANVPYYITSAIIRLFLESLVQPKTMTLLIQKEVASRIVDREKHSLLSLSVSVYADASLVMKVPKRYFNPKPKVDSAVIHIANVSRESFEDTDHEKKFFQFIKAGFAHKRKQLASNLGLISDTKEEWQKRLEEEGLKATLRAEKLSLRDALTLSLYL